MSDIPINPESDIRAKKANIFSIGVVGGALFVAVCLKVILILSNSIPFNSDEAIVGLMARHILQGARPVFFYGQAYMGSLDSWLVAGAFQVFGQNVFAIRFVQIFLYLIFMITTWGMARRFFIDLNVANFAIWVTAIPPVMVTTYTTISLGGYGETLVFGNLILWLGYEVIFGACNRKWLAWLALGVISGMAFWTLGMAGVYILPLAVVGLWKHRFRLAGYYLVCAVGFLIGSFPWWVYNLIYQGASLDVLLKSSLPPSTLLTNLTVFFFFGIPGLLGFRPPSSPDYLPWPLSLAVFAFFSAAIYTLVRSYRKGNLKVADGVLPILGVLVICFTIVIIFSNYGIDLTGRYYLPLYLVYVFGIALFVWVGWKKKPILGYLLLSFVLVVNGLATWRVAASQAKFTDQFTQITMFDNQYDDELITFLREHDELRGYTNYWVSFRLAFLSDEDIIYAAKLPYKDDLYYNPANNRYPAYDEIVSTSDRMAYITSRHPVLDALLRKKFGALGISFLEAQVGDFRVFYELSRVVRPEEIGLGFETPR